MTAVDEPALGDEQGFSLLLDHLKRSRGFDFTGYKRVSLERRVRRRMRDVGVDDYRDYIDHLEVNPDEFTDLFNTILINVTGFFRDRPAWDYLAEHVIPKLLEETPAGRPLRVWSAACASGEEAYTMAILLAEALGQADFRDRVKIYATDVDEHALTLARAGVFSSDQLRSVPAELVERYFEPTPAGRAFISDLRRSVIFGRNDLVQDAPISRIDLLVSRNALMYFTPETQARILAHFNFALRDTGFLFLGKSEMLLTHSELFTPYSLKWRVFRKVPRRSVRERLSFVTSGLAPPDAPSADFRLDAVDAGPVAQVVVDRAGLLAVANQRARELFGLAATDVGRPFHDLEVSYRPVDLRSAITTVYDSRAVATLGRHHWTLAGGERRTLEIEVAPVTDGAGDVIGASIHFGDVTAHARLRDEYEAQRRQLENAYEELQSTNEELETTNEEIQSTNEELETTNEEIQSSNEELEMMNDELQSTNDELQTVNEELRDRASELDRVNLFLEGILSNLGVGVVVIDTDQRVQLWNDSSTDLWGLRPEEVEGVHVMSLDAGLPFERLREPIYRALAGDASGEPVTVAAVDRRGRQISCEFRALPLSTRDGERYGALLLMTHHDGDSRHDGDDPAPQRPES